MTFKEILQKLRGDNGEKDDLKSYVQQLSKERRAGEIVEERATSSNERELKRLYK